MGRWWAQGEVPLSGRAKLRLSGTHTAASAVKAADLAYHLAGTTSVYDASLLQRALRDVHVATQHAMLGPESAEQAGAVLLGVEVDTARF